ncbi:MAG: NAD(P)-dependent oxidoreductase [Gemmatimonadales bacterium]
MRLDAKRVLVIGSEGNIGRVLTRHLKAVGYEVAESDIKPGWRDGYFMADINHPLDLLPAFEWKPDVVFLLAALVGRMTSEQAASLAIATNIAGINNVLQLCKRHQAKCVFFSSSEVYGPQSDLMNDAVTLPRPNNRYGLSKLLGEQLVEYEVYSCGLKAVILRPCMLYHEDEDTGDHRSAMIRFAANLVAGEPIEVHAGSARGWLHADDAARGIEAAGRLEHYATINLGHPDVVPMIQVAEMVRAYVGADPSLIKVSSLPHGMTLIKRPTLDRQHALLGFEPRVSLAEGVRRVCDRQLRDAGRAIPTPHAADLLRPIASIGKSRVDTEALGA